MRQRARLGLLHRRPPQRTREHAWSRAGRPGWRPSIKTGRRSAEARTPGRSGHLGFNYMDWVPWSSWCESMVCSCVLEIVWCAAKQWMSMVVRGNTYCGRCGARGSASDAGPINTAIAHTMSLPMPKTARQNLRLSERGVGRASEAIVHICRRSYFFPLVPSCRLVSRSSSAADFRVFSGMVLFSISFSFQGGARSGVNEPFTANLRPNLRDREEMISACNHNLCPRNSRERCRQMGSVSPSTRMIVTHNHESCPAHHISAARGGRPYKPY